MKKKLFATLLTSVLALSAITGCSKDASNSELTENTQNTRRYEVNSAQYRSPVSGYIEIAFQLYNKNHF